MTQRKLGGYDKRSSLRTARKRCEKCGKFGWFKPRETRCKRLERNLFGKSGYWCYGALTRVQKKPRTPLVPIPPGVGLGYVLNEEYQAQLGLACVHGIRQRGKAERQRTQAQKIIARYQTRIKRLQTAVRSWQKKAKRAERRLQMTDEQYLAELQGLRKASKVQAVRRRLLASASQ